MPGRGAWPTRLRNTRRSRSGTGGADRCRTEPGPTRRRRRISDLYPFRRARAVPPVAKRSETDRPPHRKADELFHSEASTWPPAQHWSRKRTHSGRGPCSTIRGRQPPQQGRTRGNEVSGTDVAPSGGVDQVGPNELQRKIEAFLAPWYVTRFARLNNSAGGRHDDRIYTQCSR